MVPGGGLLVGVLGLCGVGETGGLDGGMETVALMVLE